MARRRESFDRRSLAGSLAVHAGIVALAFWSSTTTRPPLEFITYQIELVSPPSMTEAETPQPPEEELTVERPDPVPQEPEEEPRATLERDPPPREPEPTRADPVEKPAEAAAEEPEEARESGEAINVRLEGVRRDYPTYYNNIIRQIQRCFRWTHGGSWETTVYFVIHRDGTVSELDFVKKSGNPSFDFEAMGAVDCAGKGRFGPLPEDLPFEVLPVQFNFRPQGGIRGTFPETASGTGHDGNEP